MNNKTRKHVWPVSLAAALGVVAMLALMAVVAWTPSPAQAQDGPSNPFAVPPTEVPPTPPPPDGMMDGGMMDDGMMGSIDDSSTSASAAVELQLTINMLGVNAVPGSSVELYLEDDFQVPDSIARDTVYFTIDDAMPNDARSGRNYASDPVEIDDGDHYGGDDDWSIRVFIPDMNDAEDSAYNGPMANEQVTLVFTKAAGIKNPSEEGDHSVGYSVLGPNAEANDGPMYEVGTVPTYAKISLSDEDNKRGYELVITGSGFNDGTTAGAYVRHIDGDGSNMYLWDALNCSEMNDAVGDAEGNFCVMYNMLGSDEKAVVDALDFSSGAAEAALCEAVIRGGAEVGGAVVGSDDKVAVTAEVTVPTFQAGEENYICMVDGEGRASTTDVEQFHLEPSIRVVPGTVAAGDTVNVFAQDYPETSGAGAAFGGILLANQTVMATSHTNIGNDHSGSATFEVPGGFKGTIRVDGTWGDVKKNTKITIAPSVLTLSKEEVSANESITIRGSGFGDGAGCLTSITMSGADLMLISDDNPPAMVNGMDCIDVEVSSAGQFAATVAIWSDDGTNPALTAGTHTIEAVDDEGFTATAMITIKEPTFSVTPDVAGPRDYITISGENWPVENEDGGNIGEVEIEVGSGDAADDEDADPDASGRWSITYRVAGDVTIPSTVPVKATYGDSNEIVKVGDFSVPQANLMVEPVRAVPGDTITLSATGFSLFESDITVKIGSLEVSVPASAHTDRDGALEGLEVLVPSLDPALYTVQLTVKDTVTIGELTVMDDTAVGVPQMLPDALMDVGDNLEAVFYFNDATKSWQVFDPRPEWADLNTLNELVSGQAYWILVKDTQDDVVLNGRLRSLTCSGDNCWNLEVW